MKLCSGFWIGMGSGIVLGASVGMMWYAGAPSMKTPVGKSIQKLGLAVDRAVNNIVSELH